MHRVLLSAHETSAVDQGMFCPNLFLISGDVPDGLTLRSALQDVQDRHEALRSRYLGGDLQVAEPLPAIQAPRVELSELGVCDSGRVQREVETAMSAAPLNLAAAQVWRAVMATGHPSGDLVVGIVVHHVAFDGWSERVLATDLSVALAARARGLEPRWVYPAPTLRQLARDRSRYEGDRTDAEQFEQWRDHLQGAVALEPLSVADPTDVRPVAQHTRLVPGDALATWATTARQKGATLFTAALAVVTACVQERVTDPDVLISVPMSARETAREGRAIGCLIDAKLLRAPKFEPDAGWITRIEAAREEWRWATRNAAQLDQVLPFVAQGANGPAVLLAFAMQDNIAPALALPHCTIRHVRVHPAVAESPLFVQIFMMGDGSAAIVVRHQPNVIADSWAVELADAIHFSLVRGPR